MIRSICAPGDHDYVGFDAVAGTTYEFQTTGGVDTTGKILATDCTEIAGTFNDDCDQPNDLNFCRTWTAPASGRYYVETAGYSSEFTVGIYNLEYRVIE